MTKLLGKENNDNTSSSDERYKARVTEQQQQHEEELKKLQESYKEKTKEKTKEEKNPKKEEAQKSREKEINVSRKKNIFKIITEAFTLTVQPKKWEAIIEDLKALFGGNIEEELLLRELKLNNEKIALLLHHLKDKDRISREIRIAALMKEIIMMGKISKVHAVRIFTMQGELLANLKHAAKVESKQVEIRGDVQIDKMVTKAPIPPNVIEAAKQSIAEPKTPGIVLSSTATPMAEWQHGNQYRIKNPPYPTFDLIKPIERVLHTVESMIMKYIVDPARNAIKDIVNSVSKEIGDMLSNQSKEECSYMRGHTSRMEYTFTRNPPRTYLTCTEITAQAGRHADRNNAGVNLH